MNVKICTVSFFISLISSLPLLGQKISLESIWVNYDYVPASPSQFRWMLDDQFYSVMERGKGIVKYSIETESKVGSILDFSQLDLGEIMPTEIENYRFSADEQKVLLKANSESIYRRSSKEHCLVVDLESKKVYPLHEGKKVSNAHFSTDASRIGYCYENNLYYHDFGTGQSMQLTLDGKWNEIIYGSTDWVYEEELSFARAFDFSPDGRYLAYYRFDERHVAQFNMPMYGQLYPELYEFKYPKAGEENALVTIHIYDLKERKHVQADIGSETDQYIARVKWASDTSLAIMRLNRLQNRCDVLLSHAQTGLSDTILTEEAEAYIEVSNDKWHFLKNSDDFLWMSEKDGYMHIYRYSIGGELVDQLSQGNYDVNSLVGVDEENELIYYLSREASPLERHLYAMSLDGRRKKQLTKGEAVHRINPSSAFTYFVDSYSHPGEPGVTQLLNTKGKVFRVLEDNKELKQTLSKLDIREPEYFSFRTESGIDLNAYMIKPFDFDPNRQYPVLMYVYGGPGSQTVQKSWGGFNYMWFQMLAQEGYIVVSVDNRGTGSRGRDFRTVTYPQLGKYETIDQVEAARYLQELDYVDPNRIGIWGWSYGGYMTSLCLTKGNGIFKAGIAVAPVTSWRFYDTIYTERYLQTPQLNKSGYDDNSPLNFANDLQGSYLLVHGTADDNVHYQNSMEMVTALVNANKQFDSFFYPNKNHGIFGGYTRIHLYQKMTDFLKENL